MIEIERQSPFKPYVVARVLSTASLLASCCLSPVSAKQQPPMTNLPPDPSVPCEEEEEYSVNRESVTVFDYELFLRNCLGYTERIYRDRDIEHAPITPRAERVYEEYDIYEDEYIVPLNEELSDIISSIPTVEFNDEGRLYYRNQEGSLTEVHLEETERHSYYPYEKMKDVLFFVIHYDGAASVLPNGRVRTVRNTLNGLNDPSRLPSVHFCVDNFPVVSDENWIYGAGIIQTQRDSEIPFKGRHIAIGPNYVTGGVDMTRMLMVDLYEELGISTRLVDFILDGQIDFDSYALGAEQVGTLFSSSFPDNFPENTQVANMLALSRAVSYEYGINVWEIIGHHEVQEKSDPGDEYMFLIRFLLGLMYLEEPSSFAPGFLGVEDDLFFITLRNYGIQRMGIERYTRLSEMYGFDDFIFGYLNIY